MVFKIKNMQFTQIKTPFSTARYKNLPPPNHPPQLSNLSKALSAFASLFKRILEMHFEVEGKSERTTANLTGLCIWSTAFSTVLVVLRLGSYSILSIIYFASRMPSKAEIFHLK